MSVERFIADAKADGQKIERLIVQFYSGLPSRDVFIDGGAHVGFHTTHARQCFSGLVVSVEASPKTYVEHLRRQTALSARSPELCGIVPLHAALGNRDKQGDTINFYFSSSHPGRSTVNTKLWETWAKGEVIYDAPVEAPVLEIDDIKRLIVPNRQVDFIKLDLEGNEVKALRGAKEVMTKDRPSIVAEFGLKPHNEELYGESPASFLEFIHGLGYRAYAPWGDAAESSIVGTYQFWYIFLLPEGPGLEAHVERLRHAYSASAAER